MEYSGVIEPALVREAVQKRPKRMCCRSFMLTDCGAVETKFDVMLRRKKFDRVCCAWKIEATMGSKSEEN
jgi:hypothetical protein